MDAAPISSYPCWREIGKDRSARGVLAGLCLFLAATFVGIQADPLQLARLSAEGFAASLHAPAPWLPSLLAGHPLPAAWLKAALSAAALALLLALQRLFAGKGAQATWLFAGASMFLLYLYGLNVLLFEVYFHAFFLFAVVFLFFPGRERSMRFALCAVYWLAGVLKLNPGWLSGRVFSSVPGGELPFVPDLALAIQVACWALVAVELFVPFLFFARSLRLRRAAWVIFVLFHAYTVLILDYHFPLLMFGVLLPLYPRAGSEPLRIGRRDLPLCAGLAAVLVLSQLHLAIPGARAVTQEGKTLGLFMYDVNQGCRFEATLEGGGEALTISGAEGYRKGVRWEGGGAVWATRRLVASARDTAGVSQLVSPAPDGALHWRGQPVFHPAMVCGSTRRVCCDPYVFQSWLRHLHERGLYERASLRVAVDLNGHNRWFNVVDEPAFDAAKAGYRFLRHNDWIRIPGGDFPPEYLWP